MDLLPTIVAALTIAERVYRVTAYLLKKIYPIRSFGYSKEFSSILEKTRPFVFSGLANYLVTAL